MIKQRNRWYENHTLQQLLYLRKNAVVVDEGDPGCGTEGITKHDLKLIDRAIMMHLEQEDNES